MPSVFIQTGINSYYTHLTAKTVGNLVYQFWTTDCSAVDTYFICSSIEQTFNVFQLVDATTNGKRNIQRLGYLGYHLRKRLTTFKRSGNIKETQFVGTLL